MQRTRTTRWLVFALALAIPALAAAQDTVGWVFTYKVDRGKGSELVELVKKHFGAEMEAQIAAGTIVGWGIAAASNYQGGYTHVEWITYPSWSGASAAEKAFGASWEARSQSEKDAIRDGFGAILTERTRHRVVRGVVRKFGDGTTPPKYLVMSEFNARPGKAVAGTRLYLDEAVPVYDQLLAGGAIGGYGMAEPAMHDGEWTHWSWYTLADLSGMGEVQKGLGSISDEDLDRRIGEIFDPARHRDTIYEILHLAVPTDN